MAAIQGTPGAVPGLGRQALSARPTRDAGVVDPKAKTAKAEKSAPPVKTEQPQPEAQLRGDVTGDGTVSMSDAKALLMHLFGAGPRPEGWSNADINGDGSVNLADALALFNELAAQNAPATPEAETPAPPTIQPAPAQPFISPAQVSRVYRGNP